MNNRDKTGKQRGVLVAVATLLVLLVPAALMASDDFNDVDESNTFHEDISWLADSGVTKGCNPPENTEYCPGEPVTRGQMAALLRRLANNEVVQPAPPEARDDVEVFITADGKEQTHLSLTGEDGLVDGNARVEHGNLVDDGGNEVGTVVSRFHYIDVRDADANDFLFYLDCTIRLDGGSIVFGGAGEFANIPDGGEEFAIQGGTGACSDVTGQVTITPVTWESVSSSSSARDDPDQCEGARPRDALSRGRRRRPPNSGCSDPRCLGSKGASAGMTKEESSGHRGSATVPRPPSSTSRRSTTSIRSRYREMSHSPRQCQSH